MSELAEALYRHLLSLLPPGRHPRKGGAADGMVGMLGALEASAVEEALALFRQALPQHAEGVFLEEVGRGRGLSRFQGELEAAFRNRVVQALRFWLLAGTLPGVRMWLEAAGYDSFIHEHFRDDPSIWAEFSVFLWPKISQYIADRWDEGGVWDDATYWDFTPHATEPYRVLALMREVKPAHAKVRSVYYIAGPRDAWDEGGAWDDGGAWNPEPIRIA
ncbi:hypothetical protein TTHN1_00673 [Thermus thermophilus]|uniref:Uncharacterized protein n=1 Tax=Thermus thermophilus TaxID=274 RepID=A0A3P4AR58_THETH|nr:hypothetical protein [Thermus thermophilus]VCU52918.1 hypothetical protein TTHN1_00673 [Thermus thermophilus]